MTLVATDGLDMYNGVGTPTTTAPSIQTKWTLTATTGLSLVAGRFGGQALRIAGSAQATRPFLAARTSQANGFALRWNTLPTDSVVLQHVSLWTGVTPQWGFRVNSDGSISVYRYSSISAGTLLTTTAAGIISLTAWNYFEIETVISTTVGSITIYLNGNTVTPIVALTGINNANAGVGTSVNQIRFGANNGNYSGSFDVDDYYEADTNTRVGEGFIETIRPNADGTITWTPNSGANNFSRVNETLVDGDTTYVQTGTLNNQDLYDMVNLAGTPVTIYGAQVVNFGLKTDATTRAIGLSVKSASTTSVGPNYTLTTTYSRFERMLITDPDTGSAWGTSGINAVQSGPKVTV